MHHGTTHDQSQTASEASESTRATSQSRSRAQPNLSAEQLRQKRVVNRRAQQAFRERSKENTRRLEQELDDLRANCLLRENELLQETERLREQNETLLQRLRDIASMATAGTSLTHAHTIARQQRDEDSNGASNSANTTNLHASIGQIRLHETDPQSERVNPPASDLQVNSVARSDNHSSSNLQFGLSVAPSVAAVSLASDQECIHTLNTDPRPISLMVNTVPASSNLNETSTRISSHFSPVELVSAILPVHLPPTCPLDHILLGCLQTSRAALSDGASSELVAGPTRVSVRGFIDAVPYSSPHPISRVMCEVMSTFPLVGKAEQLALFYVMHQTMKWMVFPTRQSYEFMPEWLRPTVAQITVPHAAWIDNIPWPGVRDRIIMRPHDYPYHLWTANFTQTVQLRWPYESSDAWMESDGDIVLHSIFEKSLRSLENWSVSPQFGEVFPDLMPIMLPNHSVRAN